MLKKVVITNCFGECMEYAIDGVQAENPSGLIITSIDGLGPVKADINMTDLATTDGQLYNSARLPGRNIVIKALFTHASSIEEARLLSYKYFPIKKKIKFHIETDNRIGEVEGYVESNEPDIFSEQSGCQISILCENAYFDGGEVKYVFGETIPQFKFAFGNESLDDKLIKMSEYVEADNTDMDLIYKGDADTGFKMSFGLPTEDIMDSFKVTKVEATKDDKTVGLDLSKMNTLVPNTAPTNVYRAETSFRLDETRIKYLKQLPISYSTLSSPMIVGTAISYKGELHFIAFDRTGGSSPYLYNHLKLDSETDDWVILSKTETTTGRQLKLDCIVNLNDTLYAYDGYRSICKLNEATNKWEVVAESSDLYNNKSEDKLAVVCDGYMNLFIGYGRNVGSYKTSWFRFDGETITKVVDRISIFGNGYHFSDSAKIVNYRDEIHILCGYDNNRSTSLGHYVCHSDGTWEVLGNIPVSQSSYAASAGATVYKDDIHLIGSNVHIAWNGNEWIQQSYTLPFDGSALATHESYMYLVGNSGSGTYTEEPNNVKLIENDKIVVNSNRGQKGITLIRGENEYNVLNILEKNSPWFELQRGFNHFTYSATGKDKDELEVTITTNKWYEGV